MNVQNVEERLKELIVLKITNKLSEEQKTELEELSKIPGVKMFIDKLTPEYLAEEMKLMQRIDERTADAWEFLKPETAFRKRGLTVWQKIAIAASVVLVISSGAYLIFAGIENKGTQHTVEKSNAEQDILPPVGSAILTLADGKKIALNGDRKPDLVDQGGSLIKAEENRLVYQQGAEAKEVINTITTPRGVMFSVTLADGTRAWLNTASSIRYPAAFTGADRRVFITGEVYFDVAKDAKKPFIVKADNTEIQVLGTEFNVNAYSNEPAVSTTLVKGRVEVGIPAIARKESLKPGEQARSTRENPAIALTKNVDLEAVTGWRNDKFVFQGAGATIREIMNQLQRYYDIEVEYLGNIPDDHFVATMPRSLPISRILQVLEKTERVKFRIDDRKVTVLPWSYVAK